MIFITVLWCFGSRYEGNLMCDLYPEKVQGVKWHVSWEPGFTFKATGKAWGCSLNVHMRSEIKAHIVHLLIELNKFDPNPPEITLYNFIYYTYIYIYIYIYYIYIHYIYIIYMYTNKKINWCLTNISRF